MQNHLTFTATCCAVHRQKGTVFLSVTLAASSLDEAQCKARQTLAKAGYDTITNFTIATAPDDQPLGIHLL